MPRSFVTFDEIVDGISTEKFCKAVLSSRASSQPLRKMVVQSLGQGYKIEAFEARRCLTSIIGRKDLRPLLQEHLFLFKQIDLFFTDASCYVNMPEWKCSWTTAEHSKTTTHNRVKSYQFPEGQIHPFLVALGVMDNRGNVKAAMRRKFVQINAFIEAISGLLDHLFCLNRPIRIVDAGCGKGYLTFAIATLLTTMPNIEAEVIGIDSRDDVTSTCRAVRDALHLNTLDFRTATIGSLDTSSAPDFLIALHACNTATDVALFKAIQCGAEAIAVAPCCQHELASIIPSGFLPTIFDHPILAQKASSLLTDAFRCELLSACGYNVKAVEFVDPDHTPKNILLKAVKRGQKSPVKGDFRALRRRLPSGILLERLLVEHGLLKPGLEIT